MIFIFDSETPIHEETLSTTGVTNYFSPEFKKTVNNMTLVSITNFNIIADMDDVNLKISIKDNITGNQYVVSENDFEDNAECTQEADHFLDRLSEILSDPGCVGIDFRDDIFDPRPIMKGCAIPEMNRKRVCISGEEVTNKESSEIAKNITNEVMKDFKETYDRNNFKIATINTFIAARVQSRYTDFEEFYNNFVGLTLDVYFHHPDKDDSILFRSKLDRNKSDIDITRFGSIESYVAEWTNKFDANLLAFINNTGFDGIHKVELHIHYKGDNQANTITYDMYVPDTELR